MPSGSKLDGTWNADFDQHSADVAAETPDWRRALVSGKIVASGDVAVNGVACS